MGKRIILLFAVMLALALPVRAQTSPTYYQGSASAEAAHLFSGTVAYGVTVDWNAETTARYLMVFDSNSTSTHSTTPCSVTQVNGCLIYCAYMSGSGVAPGAFIEDWVLHPMKGQNGIVMGISTGAGCGTYTADAGAGNFIYSQLTY